jgi:prepilin-type N-terminal cleavage/methylation domain-containing protein
VPHTLRSVHLRRGFTLVELMITVAILAVLATIAVPSYLRFMRRARATEALEQLDKIYKGAAIYYTAPYVTATGSKVGCQFPRNQGVTPVEGTCCSSNGLAGADHNGDERCDADPDLWNTPVWNALTFQMTDEHYYVYGFESDGELSDATMVISAHGDLDCDGIQSTYQRKAFGDPQASQAECSILGSAAFYIDKDIE